MKTYSLPLNDEENLTDTVPIVDNESFPSNSKPNQEFIRISSIKSKGGSQNSPDSTRSNSPSVIPRGRSGTGFESDGATTTFTSHSDNESTGSINALDRAAMRRAQKKAEKDRKKGGSNYLAKSSDSDPSLPPMGASSPPRLHNKPSSDATRATPTDAKSTTSSLIQRLKNSSIASLDLLDGSESQSKKDKPSITTQEINFSTMEVEPASEELLTNTGIFSDVVDDEVDEVELKLEPKVPEHPIVAPLLEVVPPEPTVAASPIANKKKLNFSRARALKTISKNSAVRQSEADKEKEKAEETEENHINDVESSMNNVASTDEESNVSKRATTPPAITNPLAANNRRNSNGNNNYNFGEVYNSGQNYNTTRNNMIFVNPLSHSKEKEVTKPPTASSRIAALKKKFTENIRAEEINPIAAKSSIDPVITPVAVPPPVVPPPVVPPPSVPDPKGVSAQQELRVTASPTVKEIPKPPPPKVEFPMDNNVVIKPPVVPPPPKAPPAPQPPARAQDDKESIVTTTKENFSSKAVPQPPIENSSIRNVNTNNDSDIKKKTFSPTKSKALQVFANSSIKKEVEPMPSLLQSSKQFIHETKKILDDTDHRINDRWNEIPSEMKATYGANSSAKDAPSIHNTSDVENFTDNSTIGLLNNSNNLNAYQLLLQERSQITKTLEKLFELEHLSLQKIKQEEEESKKRINEYKTKSLHELRKAEEKLKKEADKQTKIILEQCEFLENSKREFSMKQHSYDTAYKQKVSELNDISQQLLLQHQKVNTERKKLLKQRFHLHQALQDVNAINEEHRWNYEASSGNLMRLAIPSQRSRGPSSSRSNYPTSRSVSRSQSNNNSANNSPRKSSRSPSPNARMATRIQLNTLVSQSNSSNGMGISTFSRSNSNINNNYYSETTDNYHSPTLFTNNGDNYAIDMDTIAAIGVTRSESLSPMMARHARNNNRNNPINHSNSDYDHANIPLPPVEEVYIDNNYLHSSNEMKSTFSSNNSIESYYDINETIAELKRHSSDRVPGYPRPRSANRAISGNYIPANSGYNTNNTMHNQQPNYNSRSNSHNNYSYYPSGNGKGMAIKVTPLNYDKVPGKPKSKVKRPFK